LPKKRIKALSDSRDQEVHGLLADIYREAGVMQNGRFWTTVNRFTDHTEPLAPRVLIQIAWAIARRVPSETSVILGEEEKGASIATAVSLLTGIPLVLARYYSYPIGNVCPTSISTDIEHEYYAGRLIVNGLRKGQIVSIVEDTISTGGTAGALADACKRAGVRVVAVLSAVEKTNYGGRRKVTECFGLDLAAILRIRVGPQGVKIVSRKPWELMAS
jgi:adenine phosphoribosyltransferase